jgi:hypothetical protein
MLHYAISRLSKLELSELEHRRSGRSTARALGYISEAILSPGAPIYIKDHFGTREADRMLLEMTKTIARTLGLEYMSFDRSKLTITFNWEHPIQKYKREEVFEAKKT